MKEREEPDNGAGRNAVARKRKGGGRVAVLLVAFALIGAAWLSLSWVKSCQERAIADLGEKIEALKADYVPIRFKLLSRGADQLSVRVKFYDRDGKERAAMERSLPGTELSLDFLVVRDVSGTAWFQFPARLFTDAMAPETGVDLFPYYDLDGFPTIFDEKGMSDGQRRAFVALFEAVRAESGPLGEWYGSAVHDVTQLGLFETDVVYRVVCRVKGGIEISED